MHNVLVIYWYFLAMGLNDRTQAIRIHLDKSIVASEYFNDYLSLVCRNEVELMVLLDGNLIECLYSIQKDMLNKMNTGQYGDD